MNKRNFLGAVLIVVIIVTAISIIRSSTRKPVSQMDTLFAGMAEATADETAKLLAGHGQVILVRATGCEQCLPDDAQDYAARLVGKKSGLRVVATETIPLSIDEPLALPEKVYQRLVQSHPKVDAVVSLAGALEFGHATLPASRPKLIVVIPRGDPLAVRPLVADGVVDLAIVPRVHGVPIDKMNLPKTARAWFDCEYEVVTPANLQTAFN